MAPKQRHKSQQKHAQSSSSSPQKLANGQQRNGISEPSARSQGTSSRISNGSNKPKAKRGPFWWFLRVIRVVIGIGLIYIIWNKQIRRRQEPSIVQQATFLNPHEPFPPQVLDETRRNAVREAFRHSYAAYEQDAFGSDDHHPISHKGGNMSKAGGVGYFVVDVLDSLWLFDFKDEFKRARDWVEKLSFDVDDKFHTFEITIRVLGGLLSAYALSEDRMFIDKAVDLADRLLPAFKTPTGIPYSFVNLKRRIGIPDRDNRGLSSIAEAATLQLELKYLSELTGNPVYWQKAEDVITTIRKQSSKDGLLPIFISPTNGKPMLSEIRLGSRGDSYYEYLGKQWLQTNKTEPVYKHMHDEAMTGIKRHLMRQSPREELLFTLELIPRVDRSTRKTSFQPLPKQDHLVCFLGASLMLGVSGGQTVSPDQVKALGPAALEDIAAGAGLIRTCVDTYTKAKTGLGPEIVMFHATRNEARKEGRDWYIKKARPGGPPPIDARNILRPETVESLFVAYRTTGDPQYREWGWQIFEAFEKHCKLPEGGFASIRDVDQVPVEYEDRMETFWLSETLKYLYLLFSEPELIPLDRYVLNTEAHILPIFTPTVLSPIQERISIDLEKFEMASKS